MFKCARLPLKAWVYASTFLGDSPGTGEWH